MQRESLVQVVHHSNNEKEKRKDEKELEHHSLKTKSRIQRKMNESLK